MEDRLGIDAGGMTTDGEFSLEAAECLATCDGAPSLQINYEDFYKVSPQVYARNYGTELDFSFGYAVFFFAACRNAGKSLRHACSQAPAFE